MELYSENMSELINHGSEPFVSVIIPVYNDAPRLKICLSALEKQTYPSSRYEVIVVDNGSDAYEQVESLADKFPSTRATQELTPGSYAARNRGIAEASGEILAFTDADCIPSPEWLETGVKYFLDYPDCGTIGGRIDMFFQDPDNITPAELYDKVIFGFPHEEMIRSYGGMITANIFARKAVVDDVGGFLAHLKSFGDQEWGMRVKASGYQQIYADDAWVAHPVRNSLDDMFRRKARCVGGVYDLYISQETSLWVRSKRTIKIVLEDLFIHSSRLTKKVLSDPRIGDFPTRLQVLWILIRMQLLGAYEPLRRSLGGDPQR